VTDWRDWVLAALEREPATMSALIEQAGKDARDERHRLAVADAIVLAVRALEAEGKIAMRDDWRYEVKL